MNTVFSKLEWSFHRNRSLPTRAYLRSTYGNWIFTIIEHAANDMELCGYDVYGAAGGKIRHEFFGSFEAMTEGFDFFWFTCMEAVDQRVKKG